MEANWLVIANKLRNLFTTGAAGVVNARTGKGLTRSLSELLDAFTAIQAAKAMPYSGGLPTMRTLPKGNYMFCYPIHIQVAPVAASATGIHAAIALTASAQASVSTAITQPDYPRNVVVVGNAAGITGNVVISGTDFAGAAITETLALNGTTPVVGTRAFRTITSFSLPIETHAGTDTVSVGTGVILGVPHILPSAARMIIHNLAGAVDAGAVIANAAISLNTVAIAGTLNGTNKVDLIYLLP